MMAWIGSSWPIANRASLSTTYFLVTLNSVARSFSATAPGPLGSTVVRDFFFRAAAIASIIHNVKADCIRECVLVRLEA